MDTSPFQTRVLKTVPELERIQSFWNSCPGNRDSEFESYLTFLRTNTTTVRPHVILVEREGRPEAILTGRIDRGHVDCRLGYWKVKIPSTLLVFVYGAFRGHESPEVCELMVTSVLESLSRNEAGVAYMNFLRDDSHLSRLCRILPGSLCRDYLRLTQQHYAAVLPFRAEDFHKNLSSKVRKNLKWQAKKLDEHYSGDVTIRCFREEVNIDELAVEAERISSKSYQRGLGVGFRDTPIVREQMRLKAQRGWLRGYVLYLGGVPAAFWMGDVNSGTFGSDYLAFDPAFSRHSPGMYLIMRVMETFCEDRREGVQAIDFGPGHAQYKETLSTHGWRETAVYLFAPTLKGVGINALRTCSGGVDRIVKDALARTGLLQKIKKAWRTRVTPQTVPHA